MLTNCIRNEFGSKIKVHAIHPGKLITDIDQTDADMTPEIAAQKILTFWEEGIQEIENGIVEIDQRVYP